jgi:hypothetical protein
MLAVGVNPQTALILHRLRAVEGELDRDRHSMRELRCVVAGLEAENLRLRHALATAASKPVDAAPAGKHAATQDCTTSSCVPLRRDEADDTHPPLDSEHHDAASGPQKLAHAAGPVERRCCRESPRCQCRSAHLNGCAPAGVADCPPDVTAWTAVMVDDCQREAIAALDGFAPGMGPSLLGILDAFARVPSRELVPQEVLTMLPFFSTAKFRVYVEHMSGVHQACVRLLLRTLKLDMPPP